MEREAEAHRAELLAVDRHLNLIAGALVVIESVGAASERDGGRRGQAAHAARVQLRHADDDRVGESATSERGVGVIAWAQPTATYAH